MAFVRDRPEAQEDTGEQSLLEIFSDASRQWILQNFAPYTDPQVAPLSPEYRPVNSLCGYVPRSFV